MNRALLYLYTRSLAGSLRQRLVRLKRPKYLFGAIFGGLYFYGYFYRFLFLSRKGTPGIAMAASALGESIGALILFAAVLGFAWIMPGKRTALMFSEAEIATLFPAPLTRRALVRYKLLTSQIPIFIFAALMTLFTGRGATGSGWLHLAGWWIIISVFALHRLGASFALTRLMERGMANWQRRAAVLGGVAVLAGALVVWKNLAPAPPEIATLRNAEAISSYLDRVLLAGPGPWLLLPFRLVVRPWFAADWAAFARALWPALGVLALHYWWVLRADVSFEEASIALAQKRADLLARMRKGDARMKLMQRGARVPVFALRSSGWKAVAFVWKALLYAGGRTTLRMWGLAVAAGLTVAGALAVLRPTPGLSMALCMIGGTIFLIALAGSGMAGAAALRFDLAAMDLLQTLPIRGWQVVSGQLFAQALLGTVLQWAMLLLIATGLLGLPNFLEVRGPEIFSAVGATALLALPFNLAIMVIPAGTVLLWPAWFKSGPQSMGFETAGLRLMLLFGQVLVMGGALILPALAGGGVWFAAQFFHAVCCKKSKT